MLKGFDLAAGDLLACVARRLRSEIIGRVVNDDCFSYYLVHGKAICQKSAEGVSARTEQRRHITCVIGVRAIVGVIMGHGVGKGVTVVSRARAALVNMKCKNGALTSCCALG